MLPRASLRFHAFRCSSSPIAIVRNTEVAKPFSVAGENGAFFGFQNGECEAWIFPLKVLYGLHLTVELDGYPVPIDVNAQPGSIEVNPWRTTITYSHAAFTLKQHMFSMRGQNGVPGTGPVILFEISSIRPLQLTVRFTPSVERMWPAPNFGRPNAEWVEKGGSSYYVLHTDNDKVSAAIALPGAKAGILAPYQERPKTYPVEFRLRFDPAKDSDLFFPLLMAAGSSSQALAAQLSISSTLPCRQRIAKRNGITKSCSPTRCALIRRMQLSTRHCSGPSYRSINLKSGITTKSAWSPVTIRRVIPHARASAGSLDATRCGLLGKLYHEGHLME